MFHPSEASATLQKKWKYCCKFFWFAEKIILNQIIISNAQIIQHSKVIEVLVKRLKNEVSSKILHYKHIYLAVPVCFIFQTSYKNLYNF